MRTCVYVFKQIELPAELLDYSLWSNKSNINQNVCVDVRACMFVCVRACVVIVCACLYHGVSVCARTRVSVCVCFFLSHSLSTRVSVCMFLSLSLTHPSCIKTNLLFRELI